MPVAATLWIIQFPMGYQLKSDVDKYLELSLLKSEQYCSVLLQTG